MTPSEYLDKLHLYFFEHYEGTIGDTCIVKEDNGKFVIKVTVDNPYDFLDWWDEVYVPRDSWMHEYDTDCEISGSTVIFSIRKEQQ